MWTHAGRASGTQSAAARDTAAAPGRRTLVEAIQRAAGGEAPAEAVHAAAERGVATPGSALPFRHTIQQLFGRHDVSKVQAHTGSEAQASARAMNAGAYAMGDHVVLGDKADLHTVAHEAAHVVQQRAGVHLKGGVGAAGDAYEQHADAVADRVVRGESAEALLDAHAGGGGGPAIQRKWMESREVDGVVYARWQQVKDDDEDREDGWYENDDGYWVAVDAPPKPSTTKTKSRWDDDDHPKKRKFDKPKEKVKDKEKAKEKDQETDKAPKKTKKSLWDSEDESTPKDTSSKKKKSKKPKPTAPKLSDKIGYNATKQLDPAFTLITENEHASKVLEKALESTERVVFTLESFDRTQTYLSYVKDRPNDQINVRGSKEATKPGALAQHLIMELTNLSNKLLFWDLDYRVQQGTLAQDDYVVANEQIEYHAARNVYASWLEAEKTSSGSWGPSNIKNPSALESWDTWWDHLNTSCKEHLVHYRKAWSYWRNEGRKLPPPPKQTAPTTTPTLPPTQTQTETETHEEPVVVHTGESGGKPFSLVDY